MNKLLAIALLLTVVGLMVAKTEGHGQKIRSSSFSFESPSSSAFSAVSSHNSQSANHWARLLSCSLKLYRELSNITNQTAARVRTELDVIRLEMLDEVSTCAAGATAVQCAALKLCFTESAQNGAIAQQVASSLVKIGNIPSVLVQEIVANFSNCMSATTSKRAASPLTTTSPVIGCLTELLNTQSASVGPSLSAAIGLQVQAIIEGIKTNCFNPPPTPTTLPPTTGLPFRRNAHLRSQAINAKCDDPPTPAPTTRAPSTGLPDRRAFFISEPIRSELLLFRQAAQPCPVATVQACINAQFAANDAAVGPAVQQWSNQLVTSTVAGVSDCLQ